MAFDIRDDDDHPFILATASGVFEDAELPLYQDIIYAYPGFRSRDQLVDLSGVTSFQITADGLRRFAARAANSVEVLEADPRRKIVIVASDDLAYGMIRLFIAHIEKMPAEYYLFRTVEEALECLLAD